MAVRRIYKKRFKGTEWKSGHVYSFKYTAWENDPKPTIILMYHLQGVHPVSKHNWSLFQGINFTYIPRGQRKKFAKDWLKILSKTNNPRFRWEYIKRKYPYIQHAVRRYLTRPKTYISQITEVPFEDFEKAVVSTYSKDFSKKVKSSIINKLRGVFRRAKKTRRTGKAPKRKDR
jgi:hypothetical protein